MSFLQIFTIIAVFLVLASLYQDVNYMSCKNYIKCIQHTASGRVIILALIVALSVVNKYLAAATILFLSFFLFDLHEDYGIFDTYNCKVIDSNVTVDNGITSRLEEKLLKNKNKDDVLPRDGEIISTPSSVLVNESDDIPMIDIKTIGNVKFEYS